MNIDKKTVAFILIGVGVAGVAWYFYKQSAAKGSLNDAGSGTDTRGTYAADDDTVYNAMRDKLKAQDSGALGWVDPLVKTKYDAGGSSIHKVKDNISKAGTFLSVFEEVNPNSTGKYKSDSGTPQLWPESLHTDLWNTFNSLKIKYGAL